MQYEDRPNSEVPYILKCCNPCAVFKSGNWRDIAVDKKKDPKGFRYPGQDNVQITGEREIRFVDSVYGIVAGVYTVRHLNGGGFNTIRKMIYQYAPPSDRNNTEGYIKTVSTAAKKTADEFLDVKDEAAMLALMRVIIRVECGPKPPSDLPRNWVPEGDIAFGVKMGMGLISTATALPPRPVIERPMGHFGSTLDHVQPILEEFGHSPSGPKP
jgi:hypothetical protein